MKGTRESLVKWYGNGVPIVAHKWTNPALCSTHLRSAGCGSSAVVTRCCQSGESASAFCTNPLTHTQRGLLAVQHPLCLTCSPCITLPNEFMIILSSWETWAKIGKERATECLAPADEFCCWQWGLLMNSEFKLLPWPLYYQVTFPAVAQSYLYLSSLWQSISICFFKKKKKADENRLLNWSKTFIGTSWSLAAQQNSLQALSQLMGNNARLSKQIKPSIFCKAMQFKWHRHTTGPIHTIYNMWMSIACVSLTPESLAIFFVSALNNKHNL